MSAGQGERELLERFLRWWLMFPGRPLRDLDDDAERNRRIVEGVNEFMVYNRPKAGQGETAEQEIQNDVSTIRRALQRLGNPASTPAWEAVERFLVRVQELTDEIATAWRAVQKASAETDAERLRVREAERALREIAAITPDSRTIRGADNTHLAFKAVGIAEAALAVLGGDGQDLNVDVSDQQI